MNDWNNYSVMPTLLFQLNPRSKQKLFRIFSHMEIHKMPILTLNEMMKIRKRKGKNGQHGKHRK